MFYVPSNVANPVEVKRILQASQPGLNFLEKVHEKVPIIMEVKFSLDLTDIFTSYSETV